MNGRQTRCELLPAGPFARDDRDHLRHLLTLSATGDSPCLGRVDVVVAVSVHPRLQLVGTAMEDQGRVNGLVIKHLVQKLIKFCPEVVLCQNNGAACGV